MAADHCRVFCATTWRCSKLTLRFGSLETEAEGNGSGGKSGWGGWFAVFKKSYDECCTRSAPLAEPLMKA